MIAFFFRNSARRQFAIALFLLALAHEILANTARLRGAPASLILLSTAVAATLAWLAWRAGRIGLAFLIARIRVTFGPLALALALGLGGCAGNQYPLTHTAAGDPVWRIAPDRWQGENALTSPPTLPAGRMPQAAR